MKLIIMGIGITSFNAICNLGNGIDEIYHNAIIGNNTNFEIKNNIIKNKKVRLGIVKKDFPKISSPDYNTRCNRMLLECLKSIEANIREIINKYGSDKVAIVVATTNTGVEEYETSNNSKHFEIGNPAIFVQKYFQLNNVALSVSTACSSGIKAFTIAREILNTELAQTVIVIGVDSIAKLPIFGFDSLGVLTDEPTNPFGAERNGINIGEGVATFVLEKQEKPKIEILGIGETTDVYHSTCPDPTAKESINAIQIAMKEANLSPKQIDYINLHGTGTISNDIMEANAISAIFGENTPCSSTKPLTGHCLGAAASIEIALCCELIKRQNSKLYPHIYSGEYDPKLPKIKLVSKNDKTIHNVDKCLCTAFGFGGANTVIILGRNHYEKL